MCAQRHQINRSDTDTVTSSQLFRLQALLHNRLRSTCGRGSPGTLDFHDYVAAPPAVLEEPSALAALHALRPLLGHVTQNGLKGAGHELLHSDLCHEECSTDVPVVQYAEKGPQGDSKVPTR